MANVIPAIPASQIVDVIPSVLSAGGNGLDLDGLVLTQNTRAPIGEVLQFSSAAQVSGFFGANSTEAAYGSIYFLAPNGATIQPAEMLFAQYNIAPVRAYLWSGPLSGVSLTALQAISGTLSIVIDGTTHTGSVDLSAATSFSNAAQIIADTLDITSDPVAAVVTGSIATTTLTVTAVQSGTLAIGCVLSGTGVTAGTYIEALGTGTGGVGTYTVNNSQTVASETITATQPAALVTGAISGTTLTVSAVAAGTLAVGQIIAGTGVTAGTYISALESGTGGTGTYTVSPSQTASSTNLTAYAPGVTYDSVTEAFVVVSASSGTGSTMAFATGTAAAPLMLTQAAGAYLSQGAAANTPGTGAPVTFMNALTDITQDWAFFTTAWEPVDADKESFSQWTNSTQNRYGYAMWDTGAQNTEAGGPSPAIAAIQAAQYSGTIFLYSNPAVDTMGGQIAALALSWAASLQFTATNGRTPLAFRSQSGLPAQVTSGTVSNYLLQYGLSFYGDYTTANQAFIWLYSGAITGPFAWADSYANQIWLNSQFQLALMEMLQNIRSLPYNDFGYGLIRQTLLGPIQAALNFGAIEPGVPLSSGQIAAVNQAVGKPIDQVLSSTGWYLNIEPASPQTRAARGTPPMQFYYMDGGSIQKLSLASVEVQ